MEEIFAKRVRVIRAIVRRRPVVVRVAVTEKVVVGGIAMRGFDDGHAMLDDYTGRRCDSCLTDDAHGSVGRLRVAVAVFGAAVRMGWRALQ